MRPILLTVVAAVCILAILPASGAVDPVGCAFTGVFDTDFVPGPGVIIKDSASLVPPYNIQDPPLSKFLPDGVTSLIVSGADVPSGFHVSRVGIKYLCDEDIMCFGLDVSNPSTLNGIPTGLESKAWDADGDGNPCTVTNPLLFQPGDLDPLIPGNDDIPSNGLSEKYKLTLDLNLDGIYDAILTAYNDGSVAGTDPTAVDFPGPCEEGGVIHVTLKTPNGTNLLTIPGVSINMVYGQDIEFQIKGLTKIPLSTGGGIPTAYPYCQLSLITFADSDIDASPESSLNFGAFDFTFETDVDISCEKLVNGETELTITDLPATVTYDLNVTNNGTSPVNAHVVDSQLDIDTYLAIDPGETKTVTKEVTYNEQYCGHADIVNTMTASVSLEECICATGNLSGECSSSVTVKFPEGNQSDFTCEKTVNDVQFLNLGIEDLPIQLTYKVKVCNTGETYLDFHLDDPGDGFPPGPVVWTPDPETTDFLNVGPGECREWTAVVTLDSSAVSCPGTSTFVNTATVTATLSDGQECAGAPVPDTCQSTAVVSVKCGLFQAYPGNSKGLNQHQMGYLGQSGDTISSVPGVLALQPGPNWSNFIKIAQEGKPYTIKNVVLRKVTPDIIQCADVFPQKVITQQGTPNIRLWWPLMYEIPGTTWTLNITVGTTAGAHVETWDWTLEATIQSMKDVLELFHEVPYGTDEVPIISDEELYPVLQQMLSDIQTLMDSGDTASAGDKLVEFELAVADACISVSPALPNRTGKGTGIANSEENPACCKLMADSEWVGFQYGLYKQAKTSK